jgi:ATP synthase protein I
MHPSGPKRTKGTVGTPEEGRLDDRLRQLGQRIDSEIAELRGPAGKSSLNSEAAGSAYGKAARLASEFVAGILVGGFLGWALDQLLGTLPLGLIVFTLLGFAAGILNMARAGRQAQREAEKDRRG